MSIFAVILVCIFLHSDWIRTKITPNTDTFYAVYIQQKIVMKKEIEMSLEAMFLLSLLNCSNHKHLRCSIKKAILKNFATFTAELVESFLNRVSWRPATLLKKPPAQVIFCEYCKIFKNTYFGEYLWTAASFQLSQGHCTAHIETSQMGDD